MKPPQCRNRQTETGPKTEPTLPPRNNAGPDVIAASLPSGNAGSSTCPFAPLPPSAKNHPVNRGADLGLDQHGTALRPQPARRKAQGRRAAWAREDHHLCRQSPAERHHRPGAGFSIGSQHSAKAPVDTETATAIEKQIAKAEIKIFMSTS